MPRIAPPASSIEPPNRPSAALRNAIAARAGRKPGDDRVKVDAQVALNDVVVDPSRLNVIALGDSMMWGQGLERPATYATLTAKAISALERRPIQTFLNLARSGAQIQATREERDRFVDLYPSLLKRSEIDAFRAGGAAEALALRLFGDLPSTFPTVHAQIERVDASSAKNFDIVLLDGGANDIDFDDVVNPLVHAKDFFDHYDPLIRRICFDQTVELLKRVRMRFSKADVLFFGYYTPFSELSNVDEIEELAKSMSDSVAGFLEDFADAAGFKLPDIVRRVRTRAAWASARSLHFHKLAVLASIADKALPGTVMFVPPGFQPRNAIFASQPFIFADYSDPTTDKLQPERLQACPRLELLDDFHRLRSAIGPGSSFSHPSMCDALLKHKAFDGPTSLRTVMNDWKDKPADTRLKRRVVSGLTDEIERIRRVRIASFLHPNEAGASAISEQAVRRWRDRLLRRKDLLKEQPPVGELRRFKLGLEKAAPAVIIEHLHVDSIGLNIATDERSDRNFACDVFVSVQVVGTAQPLLFHLNIPYHIVPTSNAGTLVMKQRPDFEPGDRFLYTVDTGARLRLLDMRRVSVVVGAAPDFLGVGRIWRPARIDLSINGRLVAGLRPDAPKLTSGKSLNLEYPLRRQEDVPVKKRRGATTR